MTPAARVTALLIQRSGARIMVPRRLLAALVADASLDAAETAARLDALTRAVTHREASLASVAPATVRAYLTATGWVLREESPDFVAYARGAVCMDVPMRPDARDYARRLWEVAETVGVVDRRAPTLVLAVWLVAR